MKLTREPLLIRTAVVGVLTAVLHALVLLGVVPIAENQEGALAGVIDALGATVAAFWSRQAVTPVVGSSEEVIQNDAPEEPLSSTEGEGA